MNADHLTHDDDELARLAWRASQGLPDAPQAWQHAARALWAQRPLTLGSVLRRVMATLRFDSAAASAVALGMRGSVDGSRQMLFSADGRDVDLRIAPGAGGGWLLAGQVLGPDESGRVALSDSEGGDALHQAALDDMGEFQLDGVAAGTWQMRLELADRVVELPPIALGQG